MPAAIKGAGTLPTAPAEKCTTRGKPACRSALSRLEQRIAAAWRPKPRISRIDWVQRNVRIPAEAGPPERFNLRDFPFWREPLEALDDPDVCSITLRAATQIGKTTWLQACLASESAIAPGPQMLVAPDKDFLVHVRDNIYASALLNPELRDRIPPRRKWNNRHIDWSSCLCHLAFPKNTQRVSGRAARLVVCTEVTRFKQPLREGPILGLIRERVKSYLRYKIIYEGTPTDEACELTKLYDAGDQRTYQVPCPHCGHYQELRFFPHREGPYAGRGGVGGLHDGSSKGGNWLSPDEAFASAFYVCERGCRIDNSRKQEMVRHGRWVPKGQHVRSGKPLGKKSRNFAGTDRATLEGTALRGPSHRGYTLGSIYSRSISIGAVGRAYLLAREDGQPGLQGFFNNWLGKRYRRMAKVPLWKTLWARLRGGHPRGTCPPGALFLTAAVDVQQDHVHWRVRAWGEGGSSWLVDRGTLTATAGSDGTPRPDSDLEQLTPTVLSRAFPLVSPNLAGQKELRVRLMGVDTSYRPHRVWDWVRKQQGDRVRAIEGDSRMAVPFYYMSTVERSARDGKVYQGGMKLWHINVATYKPELQDKRWNRPLDEPGAWFLTNEPLNACDADMRQLTNEGRVTVINKKTGRTSVEWKILDPRVGNHAWDLEVYHLALADMVTGGDWQSLAEEAKRAAAPRSNQQSRTYGGDSRPDGRAWLDDSRG